MKCLILLTIFSTTILFNILIYYRSEFSTRFSIKKYTNYTECGYLLEAWNPNIHVLLIDLEFLKQLNYEICQWDKNKHIQIGVNKSYKNLEYSLDKNHFDVIYYTDDSEKDFLKFDIDGGRIIPRRFEASLSGNIAIPKDNQLFYHFWKRSKLLNCANVEMNRTEFQKPVLNASTASTLISRLRDELLDNGMFMFLTDGTLLGWYRECTIIPHTTDLDVSVFKDNYNPIYKKKVLNNESKYFKLWRSLGKEEDSLELTFIPKIERTPTIDIFIMYDGIEDGNLTYHYVSGVAGDGTKYKFSIPIYDPWCAAELHNHIFWVSCSPEEKLTHEYGPEWRKDHPSSVYTWNKSGKNGRIVGKFTKEEMRQYYVMY
ncbi:hypothetical protein L5515_001138 [Caenorhabditis briggsae]|uniref:W02B3.4-like N-terminal domain-containing protein n=1 Tax=Caenorhabditis briggsae TaxID=6238 RepID=A0AAE9J2X8_CAEBR|nr:hypothetical protein L5515_001138 [Caenorhabditis briggsae]